MRLPLLYSSLAPVFCFSTGVYAVPTQCSHDSWNSFAASSHNRTTSGISKHCPVNLTSTDSTTGLLPIPLHVRPDDTIIPGVPSAANDETTRTGLPFSGLPNDLEDLPTVTTSGAKRAAPVVHPWPTMPPEAINLTHRDISAAKTDPKTKSVEQKTFDHRPAIYMGQKLGFYVGIEDAERERSLTGLWGNASYFRYIDGKGQDGQPAPTGTNKWEVLQKFGVGKLNATDDNHDTLDFVMKVFNATSETLDWYLRHLEVVNSKEWDGFHAPDWNKHNPIDHYNWIAKAHGILGSMNLAQQREINSRIDNIDKLSTEDLIKLYNMFEIREDMLWEHKLQVAEFFQIASLKFPKHDEPNTLSSIRGPIHLVDWNDPAHPRTKATRPIDALARYWIPATDFNHNDLTTLTLIKIAHEIIDVQRKFREHVRTLTSAPPTPRELKEIYDILGINWQGKDDDVKKVEAAKMLCVRELVFSQMPKRRGRGLDWSRVPQQPEMANVCTAEEKQDRLKALFVIEKWDVDHPNPIQGRNIKDHSTDGPVRDFGEKVEQKLSELKEKTSGSTDILGNLHQLEDKIDQKYAGVWGKTSRNAQDKTHALEDRRNWKLSKVPVPKKTHYFRPRDALDQDHNGVSKADKRPAGGKANLNVDNIKDEAQKPDDNKGSNPKPKPEQKNKMAEFTHMVENTLDGNIETIRGKFSDLGEKTKPIAKDIGKMVYNDANKAIDKLGGKALPPLDK